MRSPPNILLVTADQQRADTIGALGNAVIRTPVLDRLVREGTAFTRAYTPSPVCVPARCALATGLPPHVTGCVDNSPIPESLRSFMQGASEAGYQTHGTGKMHFLPDPHGRRLWGFEARDFSEEALREDDYTAFLKAQGFGHVLDPLGLRSEYYYLPQPSQLPAPLHHTAWVADRSIEFISQRDRKRPFLLWTSFIKPHPPFESPNPWNRLYRSVDMPDPLSADAAGSFAGFWNRVQNRYKYMDGGLNPHLLRTMRAAYYGSISFLDFHLGRILDALGPDLENTLVIFTSDHGEMLGDYGCFGKRCMLEASVRVPLIVRHPALFAAGTRCSTPVSLLDLHPTIVELAGAGAPPPPRLARIAAGAEPSRVVASQFSRSSLGLYLMSDGAHKYVYSAADETEWGFAIGEALCETPVAVTAAPIARLRTGLLARLGGDHSEDVVDGTAWRRYGRSEVPADLRQGLLLQDPPRLYEQISRLNGYGPPRRQTWPSLIDLTDLASMDPKTGKTPLSVSGGPAHGVKPS